MVELLQRILRFIRIYQENGWPELKLGFYGNDRKHCLRVRTQLRRMGYQLSAAQFIPKRPNDYKYKLYDGEWIDWTICYQVNV